MDNKMDKTPLGVELLRTFTSTFTIAVLAITLAGKLLANYSDNTQEIINLFVLGTGLSYNTLFQLAGFSLISAVFSMLFISERFTKKLRYLYRRLFFMLATLLTVSVFSVIFKWFPVNNVQIWITFILLFIAGFAAGLAFTLLKLRLEKKKYSKLLAKYNARQDNS
jgi:hypothetical protein